MMPLLGDIQGWLYGSATAQLKSVASGVDPLKLLAAMAIAALFGMVHAFMPGHGKTVIVSYYLGRRTIGSGGRAPGFEFTSAVLIIAVGLWLLLRALRPHEHAQAAKDGATLAFVTGLVPCPLTSFIMVYATAQGIIAAGLLVTAGMAIGMTVTIASFALAAALLHDRFMVLMQQTNHIRQQVGHGLEIASAIAIIAFGGWLLATR